VQLPPNSHVDEGVMIMRIRQLIYFLYDSIIREPLSELISFIDELKKPKIWLYFAIATLIFATYRRDIRLVKIVLPVLLIIYLIRKKQQGSYKHHLFKSDILNRKDSSIVRDKYGEYVSAMHFKERTPLEYNSWKEKQFIKFQKPEQEH
jgi:hypothetical protein